jgi:hypothetical protein
VKTTTDFEKLPRRNNKTNQRRLFFWIFVGSRHCPTCSTFKHKCWGAGSKSQNKQPKRTAAEALAKFQISRFFPVTTILVIRFGLIWWIQTFFFGIPYITMTIPTEQSNILKHILENVILQEPGGCLEIALQQHGCQSILDVIALSPWEIETLQWTDGSKPKDNIGRGYCINVISLQNFVLSLHPSPISMTTNDWIALTSDQFDKFQSSSHYRLLRHNAPRPEPPPVIIIKDGEQCFNLVAHDLFESFDADEFEAAMILSIEPSPYMNEEETTTKNDGIIKALENAIVFFETFCLMDDFEAQLMDCLLYTSDAADETDYV